MLNRKDFITKIALLQEYDVRGNIRARHSEEIQSLNQSLRAIYADLAASEYIYKYFT